MEETKSVKTKQVDFKCPKCKKGYLRPTGVCYTTNPPQFPHKCTDCDYAEVFNIQYPYIFYE